jgi:RNA polymerase sigma factor (TIGR02999 family)
MSSPDFTTLLLSWRGGDEEAGAQIAALVYHELLRRARRYFTGERADHTLSATALVNETFVRLLGGAQVEWKCRAHFFVVASNQMRRILVDSARSVKARNRAYQQWALEEEEQTRLSIGKQNHKIDLLALDEAIERLAKISPRAAQIVELRYFGGLTEQEAAEVVGVSVATLKREWSSAKTWLFGQLKSTHSAPTAAP